MSLSNLLRQIKNYDLPYMDRNERIGFDKHKQYVLKLIEELIILEGEDF